MTTGFGAALAAETLKVRRSKILAATFLVVTLVAGVSALFMFIIEDPSRARNLGLINQKAKLSGITADWPGLLGFLTQIVASANLILFAFIATWVFGRESVDSTLRYLLALPVPRSTIVLAKYTVTVVWSAATNLWLATVVLAIGGLMDLPGGGSDVILTEVGKASLGAALMLLATLPVALVASMGKGFLAPLACAVAALILAQVASTLGWAELCPWSIPAVAVGMVPGTVLTTQALLVTVTTGLVGVLGSIAWWRWGNLD